MGGYNVDKIEMRHKVDVRDEFDRAKKNLYTIGVGKLIITKCQMIEEINQTQYKALQQLGQEYRILSYPYYRNEKYLIGMKEKDMMDTVALLCDYAEKSGEVAEEIKHSLRKDEKLLQTLRLNLENLCVRKDWLRSRGISDNQISRMDESLKDVLEALPKKEKKWDKPWWNKDVDTPSVN